MIHVTSKYFSKLGPLRNVIKLVQTNVGVMEQINKLERGLTILEDLGLYQALE